MISNKIKLYLIIFFLFLVYQIYILDDYHTFLKNKADQGDAISQNNLAHILMDFQITTFLKIMIKLFIS